jgi:hypothetical protein
VFGRTIRIYSQTIKRNGDTKTANEKDMTIQIFKNEQARGDFPNYDCYFF